MKAVRRKYNTLAFLYDHIFPSYIRKTIQKAMEPLPLKGGGRFLDIGCGTGELEKVLLQKNASLRVLGVDLSEDMLRLAQKKLAAYPNVLFRQGDFLNIELEEASFDAAFSISNLHYFPNPIAIFKKANRLLKTGGRFIVIDWNRKTLRGRLYNGYMNLADPAFVQAYTPEEASQILKQAGFLVESVSSFRVGLRWQMMRLVSKKV